MADKNAGFASQDLLELLHPLAGDNRDGRPRHADLSVDSQNGLVRLLQVDLVDADHRLHAAVLAHHQIAVDQARAERR